MDLLPESGKVSSLLLLASGIPPILAFLRFCTNHPSFVTLFIA